MKDIDFKTLKSLNILYVEDISGIREKMALNLEDFFNKFIVASNGVDGLEKFKSNEIDILITDIKMPKMSGLELIEEIKMVSDVPCIITTAFKEVEYLQKAIDLGVDGYISKPIKTKNVLKIISKASIKIIKEKLELELLDINLNLQKKVDNKIQELIIKDKLMTSQSRYALMGEMIDAIAHQIRQPISIIDMLAFGISKEALIKKENLNLEIEYFDEIASKINIQNEHLNTTIDEFKNFFREDKKEEIFDIDDLIHSVLILIEDEFAKNHISINLKIEDNIKLKGFFNQFKHLILNLLNNSKDSFIEKNIENRDIEIEVLKEKENIFIYLRDNAGGIDEQILPNIFNLNFTTKEENGTGVGLYLSKMILEKINGKIGVKNNLLNNHKGVEFKIII